MPNCGNCRNYYGKIENYRYFCCAMHPTGLPAEDCPDWEGNDGLVCPTSRTDVLAIAQRAGHITEFRPTVADAQETQYQYQREVLRMRRHNRINSITAVFLIIGVALNWFMGIKKLGCF